MGGRSRKKISNSEKEKQLPEDEFEVEKATILKKMGDLEDQIKGRGLTSKARKSLQNRKSILRCSLKDVHKKMKLRDI